MPNFEGRAAGHDTSPWVAWSNPVYFEGTQTWELGLLVL